MLCLSPRTAHFLIKKQMLISNAAYPYHHPHLWSPRPGQCGDVVALGCVVAVAQDGVAAVAQHCGTVVHTYEGAGLAGSRWGYSGHLRGMVVAHGYLPSSASEETTSSCDPFSTVWWWTVWVGVSGPPADPQASSSYCHNCSLQQPCKKLQYIQITLLEILILCSKILQIYQLIMVCVTRALSQNVTNAPDCRYDTGLGAQCVKAALF